MSAETEAAISYKGLACDHPNPTSPTAGTWRTRIGGLYPIWARLRREYFDPEALANADAFTRAVLGKVGEELPGLF